ncbi:related to lipase/esterase [Phialocephala subalpina]|uniref:Related to lipase/esterase n=1 Tax=Phialocephala subalpina TaxID=576137 RepID=A0A1L7XEE6_9HELO|nr:related to lipase/esterase [Phialocephala subalpina]
MSFPAPPFDHELSEILNVQQIHDDPDITHEEVTIPGPGGDVILSILRSKSSTKDKNNPGLYLIHGGGMVMGNRFYLITAMFPFIKELGAVLVSVEYRLAPENPAPAAVQDCYAGLQWTFENAARLGIDASKVIVTGGSAGGGLSAGVALLSRDRKAPPLFAQMLLYPMIDDRCTSVSSQQFPDEGIWTDKTNKAAWDHYLGAGVRGTDKVNIYDAPARAKDLSNLPPTFIEVGASEPFRDEDVAFAMKLWEHGIPTELHVWPGAWHAYDILAPNSDIGRISTETRMRWIKRVLSAPKTS